MKTPTAIHAAAGRKYEVLVHALCPGQAPASDVSVRPGPRATWYRPPSKVFDDLIFVGQSNVSAWAITTSQGIILIDARIALSGTDWALLEQTQGALVKRDLPGDVHPFVRGWASQHSLLATGAECAEAQLLSGFH
jgi:hypothetical protein